MARITLPLTYLMKSSLLVLTLLFSTLITFDGVGHAMSEVAPLPWYWRVAGQEVVYSAEPGDTVDRVARRFSVAPSHAKAMNRLGNRASLKKGQRLTLSNRRIIPSFTEDGIVINIADLTLYFVQDGALMAQFPVGVGRETWETPVGLYEVVGRRRDPVWNVPPSIQREMQAKGLEVKTKVPAGPDNPLGKYWLQLSVGGIGIHGTNRPSSVGKYTTHGCIRMRANDIEWLFYNVPNGTTVEIIDEPVKFARLDDGTLLMEAHPLRKKHERAYAASLIRARLEAAGLSHMVNETAVEHTIRNAWGVALDVTRRDTLPDVAQDPPANPQPAPRAEKKQAEPRAAAPAPARDTAVAVETYRRPDNYIWSGGRQLRVGRP